MKRSKHYERKLKREQEKLWRMIDAMLDEPIAMNEEILTQSRKVDMLVERVQGGEGGSGASKSRM